VKGFRFAVPVCGALDDDGGASIAADSVAGVPSMWLNGAYVPSLRPDRYSHR
jgi:hypothetical protein